MRPRTVLLAGVWALALASVAGFFAARHLLPPTPASAVPDVEVVRAGDPGDGRLPVLFSAPDFAWTDHEGHAFASDELDGRVWVGFLFLTHCPTGSCPQMVGKMAELQSTLPDERVAFVSFSIDPAQDTPETMREYAVAMAADRNETVGGRWRLLTAPDTDEVDRVARGLRMAWNEQGEHSTQFLLVDQRGRVRGAYGHQDPEGMAKLAADADRLLAGDAG